MDPRHRHSPSMASNHPYAMPRSNVSADDTAATHSASRPIPVTNNNCPADASFGTSPGSLSSSLDSLAGSYRSTRSSNHTDISCHNLDTDVDFELDANCIFLTDADTYRNHHGNAILTVHAPSVPSSVLSSTDESAHPTNDSSVSAVDPSSPTLTANDDQPAPTTTTVKRRPRRSSTVTCPAQQRLHDMNQLFTQTIGKHRFNVGVRYRVCDVIGEGAYGVVCSAVHRATGRKVAIKKIQPFEHQMFAIRTLRELKLLRHFQEMDVCENIISILDVVKAPTYDQFTEVYFIQELMETDLHRVVRSQKLSDDHAQYFIYQILRALKVMHSADVIHRDLKPSNLLLNANCDLKVCDFGLARSVLTAEPGGETGFMTEYVATRWYRAPEIMLTFKQYTKAIDVWSVGCVLAEMVSGRPLFPGRDYHHQISLILDVLGTPSIDDWYAIGSRRSRDYIRQMPLRKRKDFAKLFPTATPDALDFLTKTLAFNPKKRPTVEECLAHPYLAAYHDPEDEPSIESLPPSYFSYDLQPRPSAEALRQQMWDEIESLPRCI